MEARAVGVEQLLWGFGVLGPALQAVLCIAMVKRHLVREFPCFFGYTAYHVIRFALLFVVRHTLTSQDYWTSYWLAQLVSAALGFAVIHEIYQHVFKNYDALRKLGALLFRWTAGVLLVLGVLAAASAPGTDGDRLYAAAMLAERSVRIMQCGLVVFLCLLVSYFGLSWRRHVFGMALGFGIFASLELVAVTLQAHLGPSFDQTWQVINSLSYAAAIVVWASYFLARQPVARNLLLPAGTEVEKWNQALLQLLHR